MQSTRWSDLSPAQRRLMLALASLQVSLAATALPKSSRPSGRVAMLRRLRCAA